MFIDVSKIERPKLLAALYNNSKPLGMGILHYNPSDMTENEAKELLVDNENMYFDYLQGRVMKVSIHEGMLRTDLYNRDIGENAAENIVKKLLEEQEEKSEAIKVLAINLKNQDTKYLSGNYINHGDLQVLVEELPNHIYSKQGNYYFSNVDGFMSIFEHKPGDDQGFGGREITLTLDDGTQKTFKGTLWDPFEVPDNLLYKAISITDELKVFERCYTFYSSKVSFSKYKELISLWQGLNKPQNLH